MDALTRQEGGSHYKALAIQPIEYIHANNIPFAEGCVIKYVTRWRDKGGIGDLKKARHFLDLLIELETKAQVGVSASANLLANSLGERLTGTGIANAFGSVNPPGGG